MSSHHYYYNYHEDRRRRLHSSSDANTRERFPSSKRENNCYQPDHEGPPGFYYDENREEPSMLSLRASAATGQERNLNRQAHYYYHRYIHDHPSYIHGSYQSREQNPRRTTHHYISSRSTATTRPLYHGEDNRDDPMYGQEYHKKYNQHKVSENIQASNPIFHDLSRNDRHIYRHQYHPHERRTSKYDEKYEAWVNSKSRLQPKSEKFDRCLATAYDRSHAGGQYPYNGYNQNHAILKDRQRINDYPGPPATAVVKSICPAHSPSSSNANQCTNDSQMVVEEETTAKTNHSSFTTADAVTNERTEKRLSLCLASSGETEDSHTTGASSCDSDHVRKRKKTEESTTSPATVTSLDTKSSSKSTSSETTMLDLLCSASLRIGPIKESPSLSIPREPKEVNLVKSRKDIPRNADTTKNSGHIGCTCSKSSCIKLYCECFKAGTFCTNECTCLNCKNTPSESGENGLRTLAMRAVIHRNPNAFSRNGDFDGGKKLLESGRFPIPDVQGEIFCKCTKSKCLKLYCDCFQGRKVCSLLCRCVGCLNTAEESVVGGRRSIAIKQCLLRRPNAFEKKVKQVGKGCACKNNRCLKKYCDCFRENEPCTSKCSCNNCQNTTSKRE